MQVLEDIDSNVVIGEKEVSNLYFADDIVLLRSKRPEGAELTSRLNEISGAVGMEISREKNKTMEMNTLDEENDNTAIMVGAITLEYVEQFNYLGGIITNKLKCEKEVRTRIVTAIHSITKLTRIWKD